MYKRKKILAIIPARKGSKSIKNKNIRLFNNKPLIARSIIPALKSKFIDDLIISTDSLEIKKICEKLGVKIPFLRPKNLATDKAKTIDVIFDLLKKINNYDYIILLQPTSPLRTLKDIDSCIKIIIDNDKNSLVSMTPNINHPDLTYSIKNNKIIKLTKNPIVRRQDSRSYYNVNGSIYISKIDWLKKNKKFFDENAAIYIMPYKRSIDIDHEIDWKVAEFLDK